MIQMRLSIWSVSQFGSHEWFTNAAVPKPSITVLPSSRQNSYVASLSAYMPSVPFFVRRFPVYSSTRSPVLLESVVYTPVPYCGEDRTITAKHIAQEQILFN